MTKLIISDEAARAVVKAGTTLKTKSIQKVPRVQDAPAQAVEPLEIKPCRLLSVWTQNSAGVWQGRACFIIPETGRPDASYVFDVYCPAASGKPEGEPYSWRFWAVYNKDLERWESLQQPVYQRIYVGGSYISAGAYDVDLGGYRIDNEGLTNAVVPSDSYSNTKTLYFNKRFFQWIPSTLDIVGKKEISLVAHYETVVTAVNNGVPTTKQILVLGPAT